VVVPEAAVVSREGRPQVFALADDAKVEQRQVETGMRRDGFVEVLSGLKPGERIVLAGAGYLRDGDLVRVSSQTAEAVPNASSNGTAGK
jgi:HlyD family secretion protein